MGRNAKPKPKIHITQAKDAAAYGLLLNCRHCTHDQLLEYISENRIGRYAAYQLIERVDIQDGYVYRLTEKGYRAFDQNTAVNNFRYHSNAIEHDIALADRYIAVHREHPNCVWRNEEDLKHDRRELADELREHGRYAAAERLMSTSVPDCKVIISAGVSMAIEIATSNYTQADIEAKEDFCTEMQIDHFVCERI